MFVRPTTLLIRCSTEAFRTRTPAPKTNNFELTMPLNAMVNAIMRQQKCDNIKSAIIYFININLLKVSAMICSKCDGPQNAQVATAHGPQNAQVATAQITHSYNPAPSFCACARPPGPQPQRKSAAATRPLNPQPQPTPLLPAGVQLLGLQLKSAAKTCPLNPAPQSAPSVRRCRPRPASTSRVCGLNLASARA